MELSPNPALGDEVPGGVVALGSTARMMWDANTGRSQVRSLPPLAPASTALECGGIDFRLDGRTVTASFQVDSRQELFRQGAIAQKDVNDAAVALTQARNQYEIARKHLEDLQSFAKDLEIIAGFAKDTGTPIRIGR